MGKRDRSDSSSSGSSSDGSSSGDERKRHKKEKKSKSKKEKKSKDKKDKKDKKHKKDKDKKTDLVKAAKEFLKSQLAAGGGTGRTAGLADGSGPGPSAGRDLPPVQVQIDEKNRITQDDYFQKNAEFTVWLQEERHVMFNEMTTEQSHEMFQVFTELWNAGRLAPKFYSNTITAPVKRTTHVWAFSGAGGDEVKKGMAAYLEDQREQRGMQRVADRQEQKKWRKDEKERLDELLPKATGRDAIVEKRIARREEAKARDASPDRVVLPGGGDVFGGDDSIAAARAWEAKRAEGFRNRALLKAEDVQARAAAAQAKEDERMAGFRALVSKGPITIAKRQ